MKKIIALIFAAMAFMATTGTAIAEYTSAPSCGFDFESGGSTCGTDDYQSIYADRPEEAPKNCRCRIESEGGFKYLSYNSTTTTYVEPQVAYMPCSCDTPGASGGAW